MGVVIVRLEAGSGDHPNRPASRSKTGGVIGDAPALPSALHGAENATPHRKALRGSGRPEPRAIQGFLHCCAPFSRLIVRSSGVAAHHRASPAATASAQRPISSAPPGRRGAPSVDQHAVARRQWPRAPRPHPTSLAAGAAKRSSAPAGPLPLSWIRASTASDQSVGPQSRSSGWTAGPGPPSRLQAKHAARPASGSQHTSCCSPPHGDSTWPAAAISKCTSGSLGPGKARSYLYNQHRANASLPLAQMRVLFLSRRSATPNCKRCSGGRHRPSTPSLHGAGSCRLAAAVWKRCRPSRRCCRSSLSRGSDWPSWANLLGAVREP